MLDLERFLLDLVNLCNGYSFRNVSTLSFAWRPFSISKFGGLLRFMRWRGVEHVTKQSNSLYCFQFASSFVVSYEMLKEN